MPSASDSQAASAAGTGPLGSPPPWPAAGVAALSAASSGAGAVASRVSTLGRASIWPAWLSVNPVTANSSMPIRQIAELIQCHWCRCLSQKARRCEAAAGWESVMDIGRVVARLRPPRGGRAAAVPGKRRPRQNSRPTPVQAFAPASPPAGQELKRIMVLI